LARITRKELKSDKFALEVEHTVTLFEQHKQEILRYGGILVVLAVLLAGFLFYRQRQHSAREAALGRAILVEQTPVGTPPPGSTNVSSFPTEQVKDEATIKVFSDLKKQYPGTTEAEISQYFLGIVAANQGKLAEAEQNLQQAASTSDEKYSSLAKLSLGEVYFAEGKIDQGTKVLDDLAAHPTIFVSKEQAQLTLARALIPVKPAEARKILDSLRNKPGAVSQVALTLYGQLPPQ
jgi:predicted negative regulator of RcsB-dependent stress response